MATIFKKAFGAMAGFLLLGSAAFAQSDAATILATNTDLQNNLLFVEIAFDGQGCLEYNLKFRLETKTKNLGYQKIRVVSGPVRKQTGPSTYVVENCTQSANPSTGAITISCATGGADYIAQLKNGDSVLYDMKMSGYTLVFNLPEGTKTDDSATICMESVVFSQKCVGCGVGGSDMIFTPADIRQGCTYPNKSGDLLACYKRDSKAANWEAWILDRRDCKSYRIVEMPDGRWWFAQNLNFGDITPVGNKRPEWRNSAAGVVVEPATGDVLRTFWCPGGNDMATVGAQTTINNLRAAGNNDAACATYGALYPWATVMSLDGYAASNTDANFLQAMAYSTVSSRRGICPQGWYVPSSYDWGVMLNLVENACGSGCPTTGANAGSGNYTNSPCFHNYANGNYWAASRCAFKDLLSTDIGKARGAQNGDPALDGTLVNYNNGTGAGVSDARVIPTYEPAMPTTIYTYANDNNPSWNYFLPETAGTDKYGFSIKPAGLRNPNDFFYYRGEFAGFWTSTHNSGTLTPTYATANDAYMVGFRYNYRMNADYNSAVQSAYFNKRFGMSVRCIAKRTTDL